MESCPNCGSSKVAPNAFRHGVRICADCDTKYYAETYEGVKG